ncbi:nucleolar and coiled-body phosphoprotein 1 [Drosophila tropicalis]|uniref:nucleolar and coiled-body phosphoprotein 1 n=1 Tax=Drosophila tropicalis TaxID=46794 RepID=UPI0035ABF486
MLSKMSQPNNAGGGGAAGAAASGRRLPLSLSGGGSGASAVSRLQQPGSGGTNGRSNSPQTGAKKVAEQSASVASGAGPIVSLKKSSSSQLRSSSSSSAKDEDKNNQNGVQKSSTNGKEKAPQNAGSNATTTTKEQKEQKPKEKVDKVAEKKESAKLSSQEVANIKSTSSSQKDAKKLPVGTEVPAIAPPASKPVDDDAVVVVEETKPSQVLAPLPTTPTSERKSTRKTANQKSPVLPKQQGSGSISASPQQQKKQEEQQQSTESVALAAAITLDADAEMESLQVDASPIRKSIESVGSQNAQPAATSTPGRNLFGFRTNSKQLNEVELAAQPSVSPATAPARTFAQISGRRSIRPMNFTPSKAGSYRCIASDLDTSNCTNASMNATVGSEIPNNSSFSFSFFGRGRKRERTPPPPLSGSQSANDLAQDVDMSPPKRARFEFFSLNLASPFSLLRSRFSKTTISTPSTRLHLDEDNGEVQNVSGIIVEEEQQQSKLNTSNEEQPTIGQEAGLETPKKSGSPIKEDVIDDEKKQPEQQDENLDEKDLAKGAIELDVSAATDDSVVETEVRSRCSIM